jgi:2-dehydro-3-deoxygalactonokinase
MGSPCVLAGDWGTTNLRAWLLDETGQVLSVRRFDDFGVSRMPADEAARRFELDVRPALAAETLPAILCGMVGSTLGWAPAPYVDAPIALADLAARMASPTDGVRVAPGVRWRAPGAAGDVMRGEETQLFGWLAGDPDRSVGARLVCQPGTHAKWTVVEDGRLVAFATAMTGELYAVLCAHSVLRGEGPDDDLDAFDEGVDDAGDGSALAARLFGARARVVGFGAPAATTGAYLSGLLIGADVASTPARLGLARPATVDLVGEPALTARYARAIARRGGACAVHDGGAAAVAGLWALHQAAPLRADLPRR